MNKKNKKLLEDLIQERLQRAMDAEDENSNVAFEEAMQAIDRQMEIDKIKLEALNNQDKMQVDKNRDRRDSVIKCLEIGATFIVTPILTAKVNKSFAHMLCEFEKDYNFTATAGKSLSKIFKLK